MMIRGAARLLVAATLGIAGCSATHDSPAAANGAPGLPGAGVEGTHAPAAIAGPAMSPAPPPGPEHALLVVHKHPSCGCCGLWIEHMRAAGFEVQVQDHADMGPVKARVGVPYAKGSCHTAEIAGYFIEGHVPAEDVKRLLAERPDARGLTVPGMPAGSPGMEVPDGTVHPYVVELVGRDGDIREFARHGH